jgi:hypothetical protein
VKLDPAHFAVRKDLADVDLADRVFAPHYAKALETTVIADVLTIMASPAANADPVGALVKGDRFRVLEITDLLAWGQAGDDGPVGYVDRHALAEIGQ